MVIEESGLKFEFPLESIAVKFDDTDLYRKRFNAFTDSKGVDFISDTKELLVLTEIKNFGCVSRGKNIWKWQERYDRIIEICGRSIFRYL